MPNHAQYIAILFQIGIVIVYTLGPHWLYLAQLQIMRIHIIHPKSVYTILLSIFNCIVFVDRRVCAIEVTAHHAYYPNVIAVGQVHVYKHSSHPHCTMECMSRHTQFNMPLH